MIHKYICSSCWMCFPVPPLGLKNYFPSGCGCCPSLENALSWRGLLHHSHAPFFKGSLHWWLVSLEVMVPLPYLKPLWRATSDSGSPWPWQRLLLKLHFSKFSFCSTLLSSLLFYRFLSREYLQTFYIPIWICFLKNPACDNIDIWNAWHLTMQINLWLFSFLICKMGIITVAFSWCAMRIKLLNICNVLTAVAGLCNVR